LELRDALNADNTTAIETSISALDTAGKNLLNLSTGMGSIQNRVSLAQDRIEMANMNLSIYLSQIEDVDMAEAITQYNAQEMAYRAALQSGSKAILLNIMDFLR
ncbi:flagellar hook-associated protein 3, partial [Caldithrix abyssi]|nr:flagellar hook-associated protein 3 [Caldithrix abyssi]